ncbi:MAG: glycosyltransferase family 1 protein [Betaproteobacteria bacterium]|nr:glycosyltransferase family 1 protein [Betaproteobacteria bacterium]
MTAVLRLAVVRQRYNPHGGAERFVERALGSLASRGAQVTVIARSWETGGSTRVQVVDPFYLGRLWRDAGFAGAARRAWQAGGFDLVQSHERIPGCQIYRAGDGVHRQWLANRRAYAPLAERIGLALSPYHHYVCSAERRMFEHPRLRAVICNSKMVRDEILRHFRLDAAKLHVIYNGVDTLHFHPRERQAHRERERARLGVRSGETLFAFVGSGFARKGLDAVLGAMAGSAAPLRLVVVGRDRELPRFIALARKAGLAERVAFVGGVDDVRPYYSAADALVLPTHYDPFPNVATEALAMGLPAIISDQCGAAEIVVHGESGYICKAGDAAGLAQLLESLAGTSDRAPIEAAARGAAERLSLDAMTGQLLALYASLSG